MGKNFSKNSLEKKNFLRRVLEMGKNFSKNSFEKRKENN